MDQRGHVQIARPSPYQLQLKLLGLKALLSFQLLRCDQTQDALESVNPTYETLEDPLFLIRIH